MYLAEYFLVNVDDQLKNLNRNDENSLKTLITLPSIKIRKPYARFITASPRVASFMGSVNDRDFLTDSSGSRRFLPFEVSNINIEVAKNMDMDLVWKQVYELYLSGFKSHFDEEDIAQLERYNEAFQVTTPELELLQSYFRKSTEESGDKLTATEICELLTGKTHLNLRVKAVGEALKKCGYVKYQRVIRGERRWVYFIKERNYYQN